MPEIDIKQKRKQNLTDEEREKRRQRMIALREKLARASEPIPKKDAKTLIKQKQEEFVKKEAEKIRKQEQAKKAQLSDEGKEQDPIDQAVQPPPKKPSKKKPTKQADNSDSEQEQDDITYKKARKKNVKPPVKKAIKIKYYGDVSPEEMENDARFLQGLHTVDKQYEAPKKEAPKDDKMERMLKEMGY